MDSEYTESPLLSNSLREYVMDGTRGDHTTEYRTRLRITNIIREFTRLHDNWNRHQIELAFMDPDEELLRGMQHTMAIFFYTNPHKFDIIVNNAKDDAESMGIAEDPYSQSNE